MIPKKMQKLSGGTLFIGATFISQVLNFFFNTYLGRALSLENYALITVVVNIWYFILIVLNALSYVITNKVAYLEKNESVSEVGAFYRFFTRKTIQISCISGLIWLAIAPLIIYYFHISSRAAIFMISPLIGVGALMSISRGFLQGRTIFVTLSISLIVESLIRMLAAIFLVQMDLGHLTYLSIPISLVFTLVFNYVFERKHVPQSTSEHTFTFPTSLFVALLLIGLSNTVFLTVDILMVKHYFDDRTAGMYALLGLVGKVVFFFSSILSGVLFTYASQGKHTDSSFFHRILLGTAALSTIAFISFGLLGSFTTSILIGAKAEAIVPYLYTYTAAISLFAVTNTFITYYIARGVKKIAFIALFLAIALIGAISMYHEDISHIVQSVFAISSIGFVFTLSFHLYALKKKI
ncbi:hypothetical protein KAZ66_05480 [Candidatus Woesebacteria bacterium]|nr:hypothetical protein [Candidatus Woesebacteria bacterium]